MAKKKRSAFMRAEVRQERILRDQTIIKILRQHFTGYTAKDGYALSDLDAISRGKRRYMREKYAKLQKILNQPYVQKVTAPTKEARRALRQFTHQRFRGQKHYLVTKPSAESKVRVKRGAVRLETQFPGEAKFTEQFFMFPRRAKTPEAMQGMLEKMLPTMPDGGAYVMQTDTYGDTGLIVSKGQLPRILREYLYAYDQEKYAEHRFLNRVTGFRWIYSERKGAEIKHRRDEVRHRMAQFQRNERKKRHQEAARRARRKVKK